MTDLDLDAIEARANAATPGPWEHGADKNGGVRDIYAPDDTHITGGALYADAVFLAYARTDVPLLVAEVRRLRAECELRRHRENHTSEILGCPGYHREIPDRAEQAVSDYKTMLETLTICQARCTELLEEVRRLRVELGK